MRLRTQLFLVSLATLALPWGGCQYIREMELALRQGHENALLGTARAVANFFGDRTDLLPTETLILPDEASGAADIYAHRLRNAVVLDGYAGDWGLESEDFVLVRPDNDDAPAISARYAAGILNAYFYLFVTVSDKDVKYFRPGNTPVFSDGIRIRSIDADGAEHNFLFITEAPGPVNPFRVSPPVRHYQRGSGRELRIQGIWEETRDGFNLEVRLPASFVGNRLGLEIINVGQAIDVTVFGTVAPPSYEPGFVRHENPEIIAALAELEDPNLRIRIVDLDGWLAGEIGRLEPGGVAAYLDDTSGSFIEQLYLAILGRSSDDPLSPAAEPGRVTGNHIESALSNGTPRAAWFRHADEQLSILAAAHPVTADDRVIGAAVVEQTSDAILTLTNHALSRLLNVTLLASVVAAAGLLTYASWLSVRIRRLRNAADQAVSPDGRIVSDFPRMDSADELGDLSRSFDRLLRRLREYTEYLRTLADKLTHELRTPLAIVQTSLENLNSDSLPEGSATYARRAMEGSDRLQRILKAMSEASRIEESIRNADSEEFDINELLRNTIAAYRDVHVERRFGYEGPEEQVRYVGVPDLIVQMMDKLVDNAVDFSDAGDHVSVNLSISDEHLVLGVANDGRPLPEKMQDQLFDSMVSVRETRDDEPHLGLGLFIVRLIVEFHAGTIAAHSREGGGAEFSISLPLNGRR